MNINFTTIAQGDYICYHNAGQIMIDNPLQWFDFWNHCSGDTHLIYDYDDFYQSDSLLFIHQVDFVDCCDGILTTNGPQVKNLDYFYNTKWGRYIPQIDFDRYIMIAVFTGDRGSTHYSIEILTVEKSNFHSSQQSKSRLTVRYRECIPGNNNLVGHTVTHPYHMIIIPKIDDCNVVFEEI